MPVQLSTAIYLNVRDVFPLPTAVANNLLFSRHGVRGLDGIVLTHDHADAMLGLDDVRSIQVCIWQELVPSVSSMFVNLAVACDDAMCVDVVLAVLGVQDVQSTGIIGMPC